TARWEDKRQKHLTVRFQSSLRATVILCPPNVLRPLKLRTSSKKARIGDHRRIEIRPFAADQHGEADERPPVWVTVSEIARLRLAREGVKPYAGIGGVETSRAAVTEDDLIPGEGTTRVVECAVVLCSARQMEAVIRGG